jgi:hypothetical protein
MISKEWEDGFKSGYDFCKMLSEVKEYKGTFWPNQQGVFRNGFAEGTISGSHKFKVSWKWINDKNGNCTLIEKT